VQTNNKNSVSSLLLLGGLLLLTDGVANGVAAEPAQCGAQVLLNDGAGRAEQPIAPGAETPISGAAQVAVTPDSGAPHPFAVWENGKGQFRKANVGAGGGYAAVPAGATRLYLLAAQGENAELSAFYAALSDDFRDEAKPSFLSGAEANAPTPGKRPRKRRAVGNDVQAYEDGSMRAVQRAVEASADPEPANAAEVLACAFDFAAR
jgi:hypothetical protein